MHELFNMSNNATGIVEMLNYNNTVTDNFFGVGIIIAVFFVLFVAMKSHETETALSSSLLISTLIAYLFASFETPLVDVGVPIAMTIALILSILLLYKGGGSGGV
jgi:hypothetical protein